MDPSSKDMAGLFGKKSEYASSLDLAERDLNFPERRLNENEFVASPRPSDAMQSKELQGFNQGGARPKQKSQKKKKSRSRKRRDLDLNNTELKSGILIEDDNSATEATGFRNEAVGKPKKRKNRRRRNRNRKTRKNMNSVEEVTENLLRLSLQEAKEDTAKDEIEEETSNFIKPEAGERIQMPKIKINLKSKLYSAAFPAMKRKKSKKHPLVECIIFIMDQLIKKKNSQLEEEKSKDSKKKTSRKCMKKKK